MDLTGWFSFWSTQNLRGSTGGKHRSVIHFDDQNSWGADSTSLGSATIVIGTSSLWPVTKKPPGGGLVEFHGEVVRIRMIV
jgi:hypothetical protein